MTWLWVRPCDHAATSVNSCGLVTPVVVQRQVPGHGLSLSRGTSSSASPRTLLEFLILGLLAFRTWKYGTLFLCDLVSGSLYLDVSGCCIWNAEHWTLREMTLAVPQCLARRWLQYLALDELRIFSTLPWTRILKCLVFVLTQNGEECSVNASGSVLVALLAPGNLEILLRVFMWLEVVMM